MTTYTDLRRLMFWVEALKLSLESGTSPWLTLAELYRADEHLVAEYDAEGELLTPDFAHGEYRRCLDTLAALAEPPAEPNDKETDQ